jgi:hypothetical protein
VFEATSGSEWLTGCAEKKMSLLEKMAPQIMAASFSCVSISCGVRGVLCAYNPYACLRNRSGACETISTTIR